MPLDEKKTSYKDVTSYNNFYEFGTDKEEPAVNAHTLKTRPWTVKIEGEVKKPIVLDLDSLLKLAPIEERVYRLRCVEGWSMVIPWLGYSLSNLLKKLNRHPQHAMLSSSASLITNRCRALAILCCSTYTEGLRLDEAMHPLSFVNPRFVRRSAPESKRCAGAFGGALKYGFKPAKSIVTIRLTKDQPAHFLNVANPREYGFYSNVNPEVDHPRWSQSERASNWRRWIPLVASVKTLMFNGYNEVASLYAGMDLKKFY